MFAKSILSKQ